MNNDKEPFGKTCPVCRTEWSKVPRIVCNEYWWHCEKCEKKAKDIIERIKADDELTEKSGRKGKHYKNCVKKRRQREPLSRDVTHNSRRYPSQNIRRGLS